MRQRRPMTGRIKTAEVQGTKLVFAANWTENPLYDIQVAVFKEDVPKVIAALTAFAGSVDWVPAPPPKVKKPKRKKMPKGQIAIIDLGD